MRLGVLTGGGHCLGVNALIWAVARRRTREFEHELIRIEDGFVGLIEAGVTGPLAVETDKR